ncbi:MAG: MFS transporter [Hadesarchaea archaeon]|nr:MFS transporter [Hadesarchaea archaeon]
MRRILAAMFIITLGIGITGIVLPLYAWDLGASYTEVGLLGITYIAFNVLLSVPVGRASDRFGRKMPLILGMLSISIVFLLYSWQASVIWLLLIRLVQGVVESPIWINAQTAIADLSPRDERGQAMGRYGFSWSLGFAIGPVIGGFLYATVGAIGAFVLCAILGGIGTLIVAGISVPDPKVTFEKTSLEGIWRPCVVGFVYVGILGLIVTLFPPYGRELGMTATTVGILITLFGVVRAILLVPLGDLADKLSYRKVILMGLGGIAIASLGVGLFSSFLLLTLVFLLLAWSEGAIYPAAVSMASEIGKGKNRGYVLGIFNASTMAGWGIFATVGGSAADTLGSKTPYFMSAIIAFVVLISMWKFLPEE